MLFQWLYIIGAIPLTLLGLVHLIFTWRDNREPRYLVPQADSLISEMRRQPLRLTKETNMWRAWIGFNFSHSMGVILLGASVAYFVSKYPELFKTDAVIRWYGPLLAWVFVLLAKKFWFSRPFAGSIASAVTMTAGALHISFIG